MLVPVHEASVVEVESIEEEGGFELGRSCWDCVELDLAGSGLEFVE